LERLALQLLGRLGRAALQRLDLHDADGGRLGAAVGEVALGESDGVRHDRGADGGGVVEEVLDHGAQPVVERRVLAELGGDVDLCHWALSFQSWTGNSAGASGVEAGSGVCHRSTSAARQTRTMTPGTPSASGSSFGNTLARRR